MSYIKLEVSRDAYSPDQVYGSCTISELRDWCDDWDDDDVIILSHDNGYTYGGLSLDDAEAID